eukprot:8870702-Heterocapsa_arctica.AAC.1
MLASAAPCRSHMPFCQDASVAMTWQSVLSLGQLLELGRELAALVVRDLAAHACPLDPLVLEGTDH